MVKKFTLGFLLSLSFSLSLSQDLDSLMNLNAFTAESDLQKILNKNVAVSAGKLTVRETPGIISLITAEEIQNSGARDLTDVLRLVPGFDVLQDLQFVVGIGLRGSWANEGKVLVMMDGQPFNDLLYQSVAIGNRFPVDAIERIEIIRGPGSAIYGGSAEYGVINIITKAAESLHGIAVYGTGGFHANATGRTNGGIMLGQKKEDFGWDISLFSGKGIVSDREYQDLFQYYDSANLSKTTHADPLNLNAGIRYKGFSLRSMYDRYQTSDPISNVSFKSFYVDVQQKINITPKFILTPRIQYINSEPWYYDYPETDEIDFSTKATRILEQLDAHVDVSRKVNLNFGALYFTDKSDDLLSDEEGITLNNFAVYAQALLKHRLANATVGFRFEKNNKYDGAFVPRIALTKKIENLHFKVLFSKSFRSPSLQNVALDSTGANPERSNVFEFELGYQFTPEMLLAVNAFHISTKDVIIYGSSGEGETFKEWYENYDKSGSQGIEVVYSIRRKNWYGNFSYSYSQTLSDNTVDKFRVPQTTKQYVGFPAHKLTLNSSVNLFGGLSINPSFIFAGKRYAFTTVITDPDDNTIPASTELEPYLLANIFVNYKNLLPGFSAGAGFYDLFNANPAIPQAYNGGDGAYAPIPGRTREFVIELSYQLNFTK